MGITKEQMEEIRRNRERIEEEVDAILRAFERFKDETPFAETADELQFLEDSLAKAGLSVDDLGDAFTKWAKAVNPLMVANRREIISQGKEFSKANKAIATGFATSFKNIKVADIKRGFAGVFGEVTDTIKGNLASILEDGEREGAAFVQIQQRITDKSLALNLKRAVGIAAEFSAREAIIIAGVDKEIAKLDTLTISSKLRQKEITRIRLNAETARINLVARLQEKADKETIARAIKLQRDVRAAGLDVAPQLPLTPEQLSEQQKEAGDVGKRGFLPQFTDALKKEGENAARSFRAISAAISGAKQGGVVGALAAFGAQLLTETEGFNKIMDSVGRILGDLVKAI